MLCLVSFGLDSILQKQTCIEEDMELTLVNCVLMYTKLKPTTLQAIVTCIAQGVWCSNVGFSSRASAAASWGCNSDTVPACKMAAFKSPTQNYLQPIDKQTRKSIRYLTCLPCLWTGTQQGFQRQVSRLEELLCLSLHAVPDEGDKLKQKPSPSGQHLLLQSLFDKAALPL